MATVDSLNIRISAQANAASASIDKLVGKLNTLSTSLNRINGSGLTGLANGVNRLATSMQSMKSIGTADFTRLAKNIEKLGNINVSSLNSAASSMSHLTRAFNQLGGVSANAQQVGTLASNLSKLGYKSTANAITNLPALARELSNLMTTLSRAPKVSSNVIQMTNALANLASQGGKVGAASKGLSANIASTSKSMNRLKISTSSALIKMKSFTGQLLASAGIYLTLRQAIKGLANSIKSSMNYIETLNYFDAAFGQVAEKADLSKFKELGYNSAEEYAKSFSERAKQLTAQMTGFEVTDSGQLTETGIPSLGINPNELMNYQAMFGQMSSSMGVASETSLKMSRALTEIGADLASVKNMDFNKVWRDMASGLAGMSRTLDKYGVNIRNVNLQQKLNELGINASITALNQNDKALLRTIILLDSTRYAWGDLADTIDQPANQLRLVKANFQNLSRTIGNLFMPIVQKVLPYINALTIALQRLFVWIGNTLGVDWDKMSEWRKKLGSGGSDNSALSDINDNLGEIADGYDDAAKAAKAYENQILGFDEITKLQEPKDTSDSTGSGAGTSSGLLDAAFEDALSEYQKVWDEAFANMENNSQELADRIVDAFKKGDYKSIGTYMSTSIKDSLDGIDWTIVYSTVGRFTTGIADFLNGFIRPDTFYSVGETIAGALNTALHAKLTFAKTFDWSNFGESLGEGINGFLEEYNFEDLAKSFNAWVQGFAEAFIAFISTVNWKELLKSAWDFLKNIELETVAIIASAVTLKVTAKAIKKAVTTTLLPKITRWFATNSTKFLKIGIAVTIATIAIEIAKGKLKPIFNEYDLEEIKRASEEMFIDWFGNNPISISLSDFFVLTSTLIVKPSEVWDSLKLLWKDICSGEFKFEILNLIKFPSHNEITKSLSEIGKAVNDWFNSDVAPWFNGDTWKELWVYVKEDFKEGWNGVKEWWNNTAIARWFNDDVKPWFTLEKWLGLANSIKDGISSKWNEFKNWWRDNALTRWWNEHVAPFFSKERWNLSGIKEGLEEAFNSAISAVKGIWNGFAEWINRALSIDFDGFSKTFNVLGKKIEIGIPAFSFDLGRLPTFATGGFPEDGWFRAGKGEYFGRFDDGTSYIANNNQIETGIAVGVEEAAYRGMMRALSESGGNTTNVTFEVQGDADNIFKIVQKRANNYTMQTGQAPFPV